MPARSANAVWEGDLRGGKGSMKFANYEGPYTFVSRFESGPGTNPEELIAAAHAGCFSMAFSNTPLAGLNTALFSSIIFQEPAPKKSVLSLTSQTSKLSSTPKPVLG